MTGALSDVRLIASGSKHLDIPDRQWSMLRRFSRRWRILARLLILKLSQAEEMCVSDIVELLTSNQTIASQQSNVMKHKGILSCRCHGTRAYYYFVAKPKWYVTERKVSCSAAYNPLLSRSLGKGRYYARRRWNKVGRPRVQGKTRSRPRQGANGWSIWGRPGWKLLMFKLWPHSSSHCWTAM